MREACGRLCPQNKKEGRGWGSGTGDKAWGSRADRMLGKKEKRTVHKDGECGTMPRPRENGVLHARYRQRSQSTQRNDPACVARSTKHRAWDKTST